MESPRRAHPTRSVRRTAEYRSTSVDRDGERGRRGRSPADSAHVRDRRIVGSGSTSNLEEYRSFKPHPKDSHLRGQSRQRHSSRGRVRTRSPERPSNDGLRGGRPHPASRERAALTLASRHYYEHPASQRRRSSRSESPRQASTLKRKRSRSIPRSRSHSRTRHLAKSTRRSVEESGASPRPRTSDRWRSRESSFERRSLSPHRRGSLSSVSRSRLSDPKHRHQIQSTTRYGVSAHHRSSPAPSLPRSSSRRQYNSSKHEYSREYSTSYRARSRDKHRKDNSSKELFEPGSWRSSGQHGHHRQRSSSNSRTQLSPRASDQRRQRDEPLAPTSRLPRRRSRSRQRSPTGKGFGSSRRTRSTRRSRSPYSDYTSDHQAVGDMHPYSSRGRSGPYGGSPPYAHHNSSQGNSPYNGGSRGGWNSQYGSHHGSPQHNYSPHHYASGAPSPQSGYYQNNSQYGGSPTSQYPSQSNHRGSHSGYRNSHPSQSDRRFSQPSQYGASAPSRGRSTAHFSNMSWTPATGTRGGRAPIDKHRSIPAPNTAVAAEEAQEAEVADADDEDNPFRPKDFRVEDQSAKKEKDKEDMAPPGKTDAAAETGTKFKGFSISKKAVTPTAVPKSDLLQKAKDAAPPLRAPLPSRTTTVSRAVSDSRLDRWNEPRSRDERRFDRHDDKRHDRRDEHQQRRDYEKEREREDAQSNFRPTGFKPEYRQGETKPKRQLPPAAPPVKRMKKKILKRIKERPGLVKEFSESDSVYYRKPNNGSVIGSGTYGKVYKAVHVYTKDMVALKKIKMEGERDGFPVTAVREIKLLQSLNHDNVVKLQEVMVEKNDCFMVFEYLSHDLTGLLNHPTHVLTQAHKKDLSKQLFDGLDYLHRRGVLHRDIKAANILISNDGQLKLADFGLARFYVKRNHNLHYTNRVITIWYRSPELLLGETQYGPAVDIWSAACVMVEIFTRHAIFPGDGGEINQLDRIYDVLGTPTLEQWPGLVDMQWFQLLRPTTSRTSTFDEKYRARLSPLAFELLASMFQYDPAHRPSATEVLNHPYFQTEEPAPQRAIELKTLEGDWHEFESKALRKQNEKLERESRRLAKEKEQQQQAELAKRRAEEEVPADAEQRESKRARQDDEGAVGGVVVTNGTSLPADEAMKE